MIRVAAAADVHFADDARGTLRQHVEALRSSADALLIGGDLTRHGDPAEAQVLVEELEDAGVPLIAVLGNHDYHLDCDAEIKQLLEDAGWTVLEGSAAVVDTPAGRLGVAGTKGFGGGFKDACATEFGEPQMKAFIRHTKDVASSLEDALRSLDDVDVRVSLLHYSPVDSTLRGERPEIYAFLGSYLLAEAIDRAGCDLVIHGHAHNGVERGLTPGGVNVRNVAQPVIRHAYNVYCVGEECSDVLPSEVYSVESGL